MSGTSVDGIDAAVTEISGSAEAPKVKLLSFENLPYPTEIRESIFSLFDLEKAKIDQVCKMNMLLGELFAASALSAIKKAGLRPKDIDLIGSHGQTILHHPQPCPFAGYDLHYTLQLGEGAVIAERTGIPCYSDFRVADVAAGGQGAPLVPFTEYLLYRRPTETILLQNIGGIGNITVLPAGCGPERVLAFDTGPGNMVIDGLIKRLFGYPMDRRGEIAGKGSVDRKLLNCLQREPYFSRPLPKTTGRELFGSRYVDRILAYMKGHGIPAENGVATVTRLTSWSVKQAYCFYVMPKYLAAEMIVSGGGSYNPVLMQWLREDMGSVGVPVHTQEEKGENSDAKEAVAFALLADRASFGLPNCLPNVTGARSPAVMGKLSVPSIPG